QLLGRCRMLPGVEEVALGDSGSIPLDQNQRELNQIAEGQFLVILDGKEIQSDQPPAVARSRVTPEYFRLLRLPLLRGRLFNELDTDKTPPVAVVNEAFARIYWPDADALGKRFKSARPGAPWNTIIGVIAN